MCVWPVVLRIMCLAGICPNREELFLQLHDYSGSSEHNNGHIKGEKNARKLVIFQTVFYRWQCPCMMCVKRSDAVGTGDEPIVKSLLKRIKSGFTGGKNTKQLFLFCIDLLKVY